MGQQAVINAIYGVLAADTGAGGVSTLTTARIYEGQGPEGVAMPNLIFNLMGDTPDENFTGSDLDAQFEIDIYADRFGGSAVARAISDRLFTLMHRAAITVSGVNGGQTWCLERGTLIEQDDSYRITQAWRIFGST